ncbi:MAG: Omp28-related outer membrane protein, partial [Bacteroidota bacterium]
MKQLYLLLACGLFFSTLSYGQVPRTIMIEEFTNASCPPCASQNPAFNRLIFDNYDKIVALKYQWDFPGFDPMNEQNPTEPDARIRYYRESGVPVAAINGLVPSGTYGGGNWSGYDGGPYGFNQAVIDFEADKTTPIKMDLSHELSEALDSVFINLTIENVTTDDFTLGDGRLHVVIYEEEIIFSTSPGSNGERDFYDVMRKMLPNVNGFDLPTIKAGETFELNYAAPLPTYFYNYGEAGILSFVQDDNTKEVWQSARSQPKLLEGYGDAELAAISDVLPTICAATVVPFAEVRNAGDTDITEFVLEYTLDGATPLVENWTGTLAPGQKVKIEFEEISVATESHTVLFDIVSVNGKADYNPSNVSRTGASLAGVPDMAIGDRIDMDVDDKEVGDYPDFASIIPPVPAGQEGFGTFTIVGPSHPIAGGNKMGAYAESDNSIFINFYEWNPNLATNRDEGTLTFHKVDLTDATDSHIIFDRAGARRPTLSRDILQILVSTDCGATWKEIEEYRGRDLATVPNTNTFFVPDDNDWITDELDISEFDGESDVIVQFKAISDRGNNNFLDNIMIGSKLSTGTQKINLLTGKVDVFPNPTADVANIQFE